MAKLFIIAGPTASGKTSVAIPVAQEMNAEIISADSMAIYRRMDIGTAKPTLAQRTAVPHHLLDICEPWEAFNVGQFVERATVAIHQIVERGKQVLIVGGTPLYLKGLLDGIFSGPPADWQLREELRARPQKELYEELCIVDPVAAAKISPNDLRRIVRALEVYYITQIPISQYQKQYTHPPTNFSSCIVGLRWPRQILYQRIEKRVDQMLEDGLVDEAKTLLDLPHPLSHTASKAIGYRDVFQALREKTPMEQLAATIKQSTRRFAKRQLTWLRRFSVDWIDMAEETPQEQIVVSAIAFLQRVCLWLLVLGMWACGPEEAHMTESIRIFGRRGIEDGNFNKPRGIAVSSQGTYYVVDMTGRIQIFSPEGDYLMGFCTPEIANGKPTGMGFAQNGNLLVADTHYHRVLCYSPTGKLLHSFGEYGEAPQQFIYVTDVTSDKDDFYYVTQYGGGLTKYDCIKKFDHSGQLVKMWGTGGDKPGQFDRPMSIVVDDSGDILVADSCNHRIQKFTSTGKLLQIWGTAGTEKGQMSYPYGIAIDKDGNIYVSEFGNNRIQKFSPEGKSLGCFGAAGRFPGMFANPWDIAMGNNGEIYVVDALNHRIQCISPDVFR